MTPTAPQGAAPMTIDQTQEAIIDEFGMLDNWEDRYEYLIELGRRLPLLDDTLKTDEHLIRGCQSRVWIHAGLIEGTDRVALSGDSDALIVRGLVSLVLRVLSGQPAGEIARSELTFPQRIGMDRHLAATRSNGLAAMIRQIKFFGLALEAIRKGNQGAPQTGTPPHEG